MGTAITDDLRSMLLQHVNSNPGIRYRELLRLMGLVNGVLTYHLTMLERSHSIKVERKSRITRYYPLGITAEESDVIGYLKTGTARRIIVHILKQELCTFKELVAHVNKAPSTISWHLRKLADAGIISIHNGEYTLYRVKNRELISQVLSKYRESFVDKIVDNYTDMMREL
jgi:predicted transcriptional regulator